MQWTLPGDPDARRRPGNAGDGVDADITTRPELKAAPITGDHMIAALKAVCVLVAVEQPAASPIPLPGT